ncbi:unnamed protein product [Paramecium sonneborni]|uniref:Uncharacterized protein n=1 Tax=Paramecium sonneborni TaxID=65129 RepID=A0A8S1L3J6_9CILI|nr:unnamed protein product [Paramecium sonneborni]
MGIKRNDLQFIIIIKIITLESILEKLFKNRNPIQTFEIEFDSEINAFDSENMIITLLIYIISEEQMCVLEIDREEDLKFQTTNLDYLIFNAFRLKFVKCFGNEFYLMEYQKYASQEASDEFFNQSANINYKLIQERIRFFNFSTQQYKDYYSSINLSIDTILSTELQIFPNYELIQMKNLQQIKCSILKLTLIQQNI